MTSCLLYWCSVESEFYKKVSGMSLKGHTLDQSWRWLLLYEVGGAVATDSLTLKSGKQDSLKSGKSGKDTAVLATVASDFMKF